MRRSELVAWDRQTDWQKDRTVAQCPSQQFATSRQQQQQRCNRRKQRRRVFPFPFRPSVTNNQSPSTFPVVVPIPRAFPLLLPPQTLSHILLQPHNFPSPLPYYEFSVLPHERSTSTLLQCTLDRAFLLSKSVLVFLLLIIKILFFFPCEID